MGGRVFDEGGVILLTVFSVCRVVKRSEQPTFG